MNNRRKDSKFGRHRKFRRCYFRTKGIIWVDYKNKNLLKEFINPQGKIYPAHITGTKRKMQRKLSIAIKRARHIGLIPFTQDSVMDATRGYQNRERYGHSSDKK